MAIEIKDEQDIDFLIGRYEEKGFDVSKTEFSCYKCGAKFNCPFSFDLYNLDGECLAEK